MAAKPKSVRQDLGSVITEVFSREWLLEFADQVKTMSKGMWGSGTCPDCGSSKKVMVDMPDLKGQLTVLIGLLEQAEGRPGTASADGGNISIVIERHWPPPLEDDAGTQDSNELRAVAAAGGVPPL